MQFSRDDILNFAEWSADRNPLHVDPAFARDTHFGQCIAHGMLSVIRAMSSVAREGQGGLTSLDIEFRGAVVPGGSYQVESSRDGSELSVLMRDAAGPVLNIRASTGAHGNDAPQPDRVWAKGAARDTVDTGLRTAPDEHDIAAFEHGLEASGVYHTGAAPEAYTGGALLASEAQMLALCSYVVGMEIPGLRSLFTRLSLTFFEPPASTPSLIFRARTVRFDRHFRVLDTRIDIATPDGRVVAAGTVRGYVPVGQPVTSLDALAAHLVPATERLDGKVAFVTGGSRGLGADISAALALAGCHVYVAARSDSPAAERWRGELAQRGKPVEFLKGDVGNADWCRSAIEQIRSTHGRLDVVVLNACGAPSVLRLTPEAADKSEAYVRDNLRLVSAPLSLALPSLQETSGSVVFVSSSFVDDPPAGFSHYVAVKQAGEAMVQTARHEFSNVSAVVARPPRLQTLWNDTPTGMAGAIPPSWAALHIVNGLAEGFGAPRSNIISAFPAFASAVAAPASSTPLIDFPLRVVASFTTDPLLPGLTFWLGQLGIRDQIDVAPYGQILQSLLDPTSAFAARGGLNVVLLRVRDWLRELPPDQADAIDFIRPHLQRMAQDLDGALRAHRARAGAETLLLLCPSYGAASSAESILLRQTEADLVAALAGVPGLTIVTAADAHARYHVNEDEVRDSLREKLAHIPYKEPYYHTLATLIARHAHRRTAPVRKVVVVDCDNTLWSGVVGEAGAEGIEFHPAHLELQDTLTRLTQSGMIVCLCSKNEAPDVWKVFETRADFRLRREDVVAAAINWQPKSENLRSLAARLNLGIDSFIFIDDNPVECAEVRARCPEVLTLQWPADDARARQLLEHTWELDAVQSTKEDAKRAQMYRDEFKRQESRQGAHTFADFISNLGLQVDIAALNADDLRRAAQLTLRTNQFNFTTVRREETDVQALTADGRHEVRTIRVRDRFGDYGLVGLVIAERQDERLLTDTFLLSCRVLGRGVEHRIAAELGRIAVNSGLGTVRMRVETTARNTPARNFLESIAGIGARRGDEQRLECDFPAGALAQLEYTPSGDGEAVVDDGETAPAAAGGAADVDRNRHREAVIGRTAFEWSDAASLQAAIEGRPTTAPHESAAASDVAAAVYAAFAHTLRMPDSAVKEIDSLEALGCDSLKIVEITVALLEKFPWLPSTLLFEHRTVGAIAKEAAALAAPGGSKPAVSTVVATAGREAAAPAREDIAVVGLDVRCAGVDSPEDLWNLLSSGRSAVRPVDPRRQFFFHELQDSRPHFAGLIDDVSRFDAEFFGISPREAEFVDPQLRLFLEVAWHALEDAGGGGARHEPDTGVFVGVMYGDYGPPANLSAKASGNVYRSWEGFSLANRLSQLLGFRGPSLAVDTACSSSGTALHLAVRALQAGDCRAAIVGGVNLILDPDRFGSLGRLGILSAAGTCEPFGADADGTVLGEGAGAVLLRPLSEAQRRGDRIYGVIKGTGLSTGSGTVGFTAPNPQAQAEAIRRALDTARIDPRTVTYVETHGTGTALGDPIEVRGLTLAYGDGGHRDDAIDFEHRCRIGSIKPNVGHMEAGAGIVGLIKILLQMQRGMLLPSLTSAQPSPHIPFGQIPFDVQRTLEPWERRTAFVGGDTVTIPRRAGLSSFGVGGANAHVIVEEAPAPAVAAPAADRPAHVLALSAPTEEALHRQLASAQQFVVTHEDAAIGDLCFSANVGHRLFEHRFAVPVTNAESLATQLAQALEGRTPAGAARGAVKEGAAPRVAFLFTGQGAQYAGMGRRLYETHPVFRGALDRCARIFDQLLGEPLLDLLFAEPGSDKASLLNQTGFTQPALFAFEYALAELWRSWGVVPEVVMGHSVGEIAAMCVAGGVSLDDGLKLIAARGRLMQALPAGGSMTSVMAAETRVLAAIAGAEDRVAIAAINAPAQVVISGAGTAIAEISSRLEADGIKTKPLIVSHAFHSPLMRPMIAEYEAVVRSVTFTTPRIPFISCVDGALVTTEVTRPEYWLRQVTDPVRFATGMKVAEDRGVDAYVEIGPHPVLLAMGRECAGERGRSVAWLPSLRRDTDPWPTMLAALARLHTLGAPIDWAGFDAPYARRRTSAPGYAFAKKGFWLRSLPSSPVVLARPDAVGDQGVQPGTITYEVLWKAMPRNTASAAGHARHWVLLGQDDDTTRKLRTALLKPGHSVTTVVPGVRFAHTSEHIYGVDPRKPDDLVRLVAGLRAQGQTPLAFVHLWGLGAPDNDSLTRELLEQAERLVLGGALGLVQAVVGGTPAPIWFVTRGAVTTDGLTPVSVAQTPLWGFGRTVALEHPEAWGGLIDLPAEERERDLEELADTILSGTADDQIALRNGERFAPRLTPRTRSPRTVAFDGNGTFLITGGTGALGQRVAKWLVGKGVRHVAMVSRRGTLDTAGELTRAELQSAGASVAVMAADVTREDDVVRLLERFAGGTHPLKGIVHAAGVDTPAALKSLSTDALEAVFAPKAAGAWLLHQKTLGLPLEAFVVFSSMASVLGSQGRAHYGAANGFLDGLVAERRRLGLPAVGVNWGPWTGGGMATGEQLKQYERIGNRGLDPAVALEVLEELVAARGAQVTVADIDWSMFRPAYEARRTRPMVSALDNASAPAATTPAAAMGTTWVEQLNSLPAAARESRLTDLLRSEVAETLGFERSEDVPVDRNFYDAGMDSLMMADLVGRLRQRVGISTSALIFDHPEVRSLAKHLMDRLELEGGDGARAARTATPVEEEPSGGIRIVGFTPALEPALIEFQLETFPDRNASMIPRRFNWMFVDSAARLGADPRVWLCQESERIVGQMGAIPVRVQTAGAQHDTAWFVDSMVRDAYRNMALGTKLLAQGQEDVPFALSLGQTAEMRQIQFRLGWKQVAPLQTAQLLIRPERVLRGKMPGAVAWAAGLGLRASTAARGLVTARSVGTGRETSRFGDAHECVWQQMSRDVSCAVVRDASYLNWKYVDQPGQDFLRLELVDGGDVRAVAICMFREADEFYKYKRAFLVDLLVPPSDASLTAQAVNMVATAAADAGADSLTCLHVGGWLTQALRRAGFHMRTPERFLLVQPGALPDHERDGVLDERGWYVSQGDSDLDRP